MNIGRRIYYELSTGNIVCDTGDRSGDVVQTTVEQDYASYHGLSARVPDTIGVLQLDYGAYAQEFALASGYSVDVASNALVFTYPDPANPTVLPKTPDQIKVEQLESDNAALNEQLSRTNQDLAGFMDYVMNNYTPNTGG